MKIIEWNSQGAFRKKNKKILSLNPDIIIVPECENEEKLQFGKLTPKPNDFFWYGDNPNKGIGIFSYSEFKFELLKEFNPRFRFIIPLKVIGKDYSFILFSIWTQDNKEKCEERYIGQIWLAINYYSDFLLNENTVLIGDFNSNKIWDYIERVGNHSDVVEKLKEKKIYSLYHKKNKLEHGKEEHATLYMYRNIEKPYHIDYCFASEEIINNGFDFSIGKPEEWIGLSDHMPIMIIINKISKKDLVNSLAKGLQSKFEELLPATKEKFKNLIENLINQAKLADEKNVSMEKDRKKQIEIIEDAERILRIDKIIRQFNNNKC